MASSFSRLVFSVLFSILFTMALFYATFILPHTMNDALRRYFPDIPTGVEVSEHIRFIYQRAMIAGLLAFVLSIIFIILGFIMRWAKISLVGALTLYLPVFSGFAISMFLFAGIGVLRYIWYPLIRILGGHAGVLIIGYSALSLPLLILSSPLLVVLLVLYSSGITVSAPIAAFVASVLIITITFAGFIILSVSVATWLYYRLSGVRVIKQGVYRYTRHPQYLGLLLWCYSLLYLYPRIRVFSPTSSTLLDTAIHNYQGSPH